jgi:hypothetical protein
MGKQILGLVIPLGINAVHESDVGNHIAIMKAKDWRVRVEQSLR